jgi:hypothetical protein
MINPAFARHRVAGYLRLLGHLPELVNEFFKGGCV